MPDTQPRAPSEGCRYGPSTLRLAVHTPSYGTLRRLCSQAAPPSGRASSCATLPVMYLALHGEGGCPRLAKVQACSTQVVLQAGSSQGSREGRRT